MNAKEIQRLRHKFILISMFSLFLVMLFIGMVINTISYSVTTVSIRNTLARLSENNGQLEEQNRKADYDAPGLPSFTDAYSPSYRHNHFFIFHYDTESNLAEFISNTDSDSENDLVTKYADIMSHIGKNFGRYGTYYYLRSESDSHLTVAVMDCTSELSSLMRLFSATVGTCMVALLITLALVLILSDRMIQPEIENSMRQKQFITNASHELKTPLAVIRANTELMEMMHGEDEWTKSTLKQVDHLNGLIQNLVLIAKAQEREDKSQMTEVDASAAIEESVKNFDALALQSEKQLIHEIEPDLRLVADESRLRQLATLLVDNAIKYCDEKGTVTVSLSSLRKGKSLRLVVSNSFKEGAGLDCNRFFDRFYREDQSHNIDQGGYGIGLSIAESICRQNGGNIRASWKDGIISFTCTLT